MGAHHGIGNHASGKGFDRNSVHRGRGAALNLKAGSRNGQREAFADGWRDRPTADEDGGDAIKTVVTEERAKSIITRNESPDIPFRYSLNPIAAVNTAASIASRVRVTRIAACRRGSIFETRLFAKTNAAELLRVELSRTGYEPGRDRRWGQHRCLPALRKAIRHHALMFGSDERVQPALWPHHQVRVDRARHRYSCGHGHAQSGQCLRICHHARSSCFALHGTAHRRAHTAAANHRALGESGDSCGSQCGTRHSVLTDHELETILVRARDAGASTAGYILLRLPYELKELFRNWLEQHFPLKAQHVMSRVNEMRGGSDNDPNFGSRMVGEGIFARLLNQRFHKACDKVGLTSHGQGEVPAVGCHAVRGAGAGVTGEVVLIQMN